MLQLSWFRTFSQSSKERSRFTHRPRRARKSRHSLSRMAKSSTAHKRLSSSRKTRLECCVSSRLAKVHRRLLLTRVKKSRACWKSCLWWNRWSSKAQRVDKKRALWRCAGGLLRCIVTFRPLSSAHRPPQKLLSGLDSLNDTRTHLFLFVERPRVYLSWWRFSRAKFQIEERRAKRRSLHVASLFLF